MEGRLTTWGVEGLGVDERRRRVGRRRLSDDLGAAETKTKSGSLTACFEKLARLVTLKIFSALPVLYTRPFLLAGGYGNRL